MEIQFGGNLHDEWKVFDGDVDAMCNFLDRTSGGNAWVRTKKGKNHLVFLEFSTMWDLDADGNEIEGDSYVVAYEYGIFGDHGDEFSLSHGDIVYPLKYPYKMTVELSDVI